MLEGEADVDEGEHQRWGMRDWADEAARLEIEKADDGGFDPFSATREAFLSFGTVGILAGLFLVPALLLLDAFFTHNRVLGVFAVELAVGLLLVLNPWRLRSRLPLIGSSNKLVSAVGWGILSLLGAALLLASAPISLPGVLIVRLR